METALTLIRRWEGCYLKPYLCPAGIPTIGYGATYYENGQRVTLLDEPITRERAEGLLIWMVTNVYEPAVKKLCPQLNSPERIASITDFAFNLGVSRLSSSNLRKKINQKNWDAARKELMKWTHGGGRVLPGLVKRRKAEADLI